MSAGYTRLGYERAVLCIHNTCDNACPTTR